jgi:hypothetical protein
MAAPRPTRRITTSSIAALVLAVAVGIAGAVTLATRPTLEDFVVAADAACAKDDARIAKLKLGDSMITMGTYASGLAKVTAETAEELDGLGHPSDARIDDLIEGMRAGSAAAKRMSAAAPKRDYAVTSVEIDKTSAAFDRSDRAARALRMAECGRTVAKMTDGDTKTVPPILKRAFINDANTECRKSLDELGEPNLDDPAAAQAFLNESIATVKTLNQRLRALKPPKAEAAQVEKVFAAFEAMITSAESFNETIRAQDIAAVETRLLDLIEKSERANSAADQYGMADCGSGPLV